MSRLALRLYLTAIMAARLAPAAAVWSASSSASGSLPRDNDRSYVYGYDALSRLIRGVGRRLKLINDISR